MAESVTCSPQFLKQLTQLEKAGGRAIRAIKQAEAIARQLNQEEAGSLFLRNKQTNSGEKRLKDIEKYDLGAGYRLVCRRQAKGISLEFIGTHDKTDLWINHNRIAKTTVKNNTEEQVGFSLFSQEVSHSEKSRPVPESEADIYEEKLMQRIDDKLLQQIFSGLLNSPVIQKA